MNLMSHYMSEVYMELFKSAVISRRSRDLRKRDYSTGEARPNAQGRNEKCSCGSGLKYKKCCGKEVCK